MGWMASSSTSAVNVKWKSVNLLHEMLEFLADEVEELGNQREIEHIERIIREGTGADRQLAVWERTQDMKAVVDQIVAETNEGFGLAFGIG